VAVGRTYLLPPLSFGGASLVQPWLRFHAHRVTGGGHPPPVPKRMMGRPISVASRSRMCKHSRRSRRPHWRNFIRSAEHAHRGKEPNYRASVGSELPPYAGGRPCLQGSTRSFRGAGERARATYSCLPQLLTSSRSFLGSSAERRMAPSSPHLILGGLVQRLAKLSLASQVTECRMSQRRPSPAVICASSTRATPSQRYIARRQIRRRSPRRHCQRSDRLCCRYRRHSAG
jgi:hypothetical protein